MPQLKLPPRHARDNAAPGAPKQRDGGGRQAAGISAIAAGTPPLPHSILQASPPSTHHAVAHPARPRQPSCALWRRLATHPLDDARDGRPFSARLRQATGWGEAHTQRVLLEYRRFLSLAVRRRGRVCPSCAVDEAWHTHLLDTARYFGDFCPSVLGTTLHHAPSRGGDGISHQRHSRATLRAYRWAFGENPPTDLWPPPAQRFDERWRRVNRHTHWVLPRPARALRLAMSGNKAAAHCASSRAVRPWAMALILPALLVLGCSQGRLNILPHHSGPQFLNQYFWALVTLLLIGLWRAVRGKPACVHPVNAGQLGVIDYAYLAGGAMRAVSTSLGRLLQRSAISLNPSSNTTSGATPMPWRANFIQNATEPASDTTELERSIWEHIRRGGTPETLLSAQYAALNGLHADLYHRGLLNAPARDQRHRNAGDRIYSAAWLLILLWGVLRLVYGWQHGHAISLLVILLVVALLLGGLMHSRLPHRRTREGHAAVRQATRNLCAARPLVSTDRQMPLGLALLGPGALGPDLEPLRDSLGLLQPRDAGGSGCGGTSCGGSGGCGGSDGGCGGGGD